MQLGYDRLGHKQHGYGMCELIKATIVATLACSWCLDMNGSPNIRRECKGAGYFSLRRTQRLCPEVPTKNTYKGHSAKCTWVGSSWWHRTECDTLRTSTVILRNIYWLYHSTGEKAVLTKRIMSFEISSACSFEKGKEQQWLQSTGKSLIPRGTRTLTVYYY